MNVMEIVSGAGMNGAILHCLLLSRELARRGNKVTLVCRPGAWIADQLAPDPVEVIPSDLHRWPTDELRRITGIIRRQTIDVVHTHQSRAHFFGILLRWMAGVPSIATAHSRHFQLHWMFNDQVVAVSDSTRRYHQWRNLVRPSRIVTVHNFIDHHRISEVRDDARERMRTSLGLGQSDLVIGVTGTVGPRKGLIYLVKAMPKILAAVPQARLLAVGATDNVQYMEETKSTARKLGVESSIIWTGHREDVHELLAATDLFALPSLEESLPLAILEAMAAGLPVVATTVGGIPECVSHGETGALVPPADSDALAEAIVAIVRDPALQRRFGKAARKRVLQSFSPESQTARMEKVFQRVVGRRRAA